MTISCRASLPPNTRLRDVANVLGILLGLPARLDPCGKSVACHVSGVSRLGCVDIPEMARIVLSNERKHSASIVAFNWHWEARGRHLLTWDSCPRHIAAMLGAIAFFGGTVQYQDHTEGVDGSFPDRSDEENCPEDGEPWERLQRRMATVVPLTRKQIAACRKLAAYP